MAVGGGTKNPLWLQIIADMLDWEILVPEVTIGACYGDAILCAFSCGCYDNFILLVKKNQGGSNHPAHSEKTTPFTKRGNRYFKHYTTPPKS